MSKDREWGDGLRRISEDPQGVKVWLIEARNEYTSLAPEERKTLREWLSRMEETARLPGGGPLVHWEARIHVSFVTGEQELVEECADGSEVKHRVPKYGEVALPIGTLKRAIEAWDRGESFIPKGLDDIS